MSAVGGDARGRESLTECDADADATAATATIVLRVVDLLVDAVVTGSQPDVVLAGDVSNMINVSCEHARKQNQPKVKKWPQFFFCRAKCAPNAAV